MAIDRRHGIYGVQVHLDGVGGSTLIGGITQQEGGINSEITQEPTSGEVTTRFQAINAQNPAASFTTMAIQDALDAIGQNGLAIPLPAAPGIDFFAQKHAEGGTRAAGAVHRRYRFAEGIVIPRSLSVDHQGDASLNYDLIATFDGTNDPLVESDTITLPTGLTDNERFTIGPVTIESVLLTQIKSFQIDFGINVEVEGGDSDIFPTFVSIKTIQPVLTLTGIDVEWLKSDKIPRSGKCVTHANTKIFLRKRKCPSFVADNVAEHIKITAEGLAHVTNAFSGDPVGATIVMPMKFDGTNLPMVINTASIIS